MNTPVRSEDEDARKLALAPKNSPRYLQHSDGSWSFVGDDGWPVSPEEFCADLVSEYGIDRNEMPVRARPGLPNAE
ncbi:MAG: hypothetical protein J2P18_01440 [Nocardia sp.]|nr:hypothetical protein [Nocardia sp.]